MSSVRFHPFPPELYFRRPGSPGVLVPLAFVDNPWAFDDAEAVFLRLVLALRGIEVPDGWGCEPDLVEDRVRDYGWRGQKAHSVQISSLLWRRTELSPRAMENVIGKLRAKGLLVFGLGSDRRFQFDVAGCERYIESVNRSSESIAFLQRIDEESLALTAEALL
jgi:hypothetical protein